MPQTDFNLEEEFGWFVNGIADYVDANPDAFLEHHGVKGMHWGVRKDRGTSTGRPRKARPELKSLGPDKVERKTASGETITMTKQPPPAIARFMARYSSKYRESMGHFASVTIHDGQGNKIGDASVHKVNKDELNLIWLGIDKHARGKGYATAAMKAAEEFGRQSGFKKLTLEVPGNSPDARHIYTKLGFKVVKEADPEQAKTDSVWGGLTHMEYTIGEVKHVETVEDVLAHYGVLGMKWGQHLKSHGVKATAKKATADAKAHVKKDIKERTATTTTVRTKPGQMVRVVGGVGRNPHGDAIAARTAEQIAKKNTLDSLSNQELQHLVNRMNLESQYRNLAVHETRASAGEKFATGLLNDHGDKALGVVMGPLAPVGKKVLESSLKNQNKAMLGGKVKDKKNK